MNRTILPSNGTKLQEQNPQPRMVTISLIPSSPITAAHHALSAHDTYNEDDKVLTLGQAKEGLLVNPSLL